MDANVEFDAVPDLCEMAAHGDDRLRELAAAGPLKIAACYPRAVKWLFAAAGAQLSDRSVRVWNMRVELADVVIDGLIHQPVHVDPSGQQVEFQPDGNGAGSAPASDAPENTEDSTVRGDRSDSRGRRELAS
jgi:hypothetical protein